MSQPTPTFPGRVDEQGALRARDRRALSAYLKTLAGKDVEIVVRLKDDRKMSTPQMRWWRGVAVPAIAEALGYDRHERDTLHYWLLMECFGTREFRGKLIANVPHSSDLPVPIASELMEWVVRWAPEHCNGLVIPLPNEVDLDSAAA